jgi:hypothetical protein
MAYVNEETEKVMSFLADMLRNVGEPGKSVEFYAGQALVILTVEKLNVQIATLESIKHLLNDDQVKDIEQMIAQFEGMKATLYNTPPYDGHED